MSRIRIAGRTFLAAGLLLLLLGLLTAPADAAGGNAPVVYYTDAHGTPCDTIVRVVGCVARIGCCLGASATFHRQLVARSLAARIGDRFLCGRADPHGPRASRSRGCPTAQGAGGMAGRAPLLV